MLQIAGCECAKRVHSVAQIKIKHVLSDSEWFTYSKGMKYCTLGLSLVELSLSKHSAS